MQTWQGGGQAALHLAERGTSHSIVLGRATGPVLVFDSYISDACAGVLPAPLFLVLLIPFFVSLFLYITTSSYVNFSLICPFSSLLIFTLIPDRPSLHIHIPHPTAK